MPNPTGMTVRDESADVDPPHGRSNAAWLGSVPLPKRANTSLSSALCVITHVMRARTGGVSVVIRNAGSTWANPCVSVQRTWYQYAAPATSAASVSVHW